MPTPQNGFQILNLHPKKHLFKKNALFLMYFCLSNTSESDLHILESLYNYKTNPVLNSSQSAHPLNIVNKWITWRRECVYSIIHTNLLLRQFTPPVLYLSSSIYLQPMYLEDFMLWLL